MFSGSTPLVERRENVPDAEPPRRRRRDSPRSSEPSGTPRSAQALVLRAIEGCEARGGLALADRLLTRLGAVLEGSINHTGAYRGCADLAERLLSQVSQAPTLPKRLIASAAVRQEIIEAVRLLNSALRAISAAAALAKVGDMRMEAAAASHGRRPEPTVEEGCCHSRGKGDVPSVECTACEARASLAGRYCQALRQVLPELEAHERIANRITLNGNKLAPEVVGEYAALAAEAVALQSWAESLSKELVQQQEPEPKTWMAWVLGSFAVCMAPRQALPTALPEAYSNEVTNHISRLDAKPLLAKCGNVLRCAPDMLRFPGIKYSVHTDDGSTLLHGAIHRGAKIIVLERKGSWVRGKRGWLPLVHQARVLFALETSDTDAALSSDDSEDEEDGR